MVSFYIYHLQSCRKWNTITIEKIAHKDRKEALRTYLRVHLYFLKNYFESDLEVAYLRSIKNTLNILYCSLFQLRLKS